MQKFATLLFLTVIALPTHSHARVHPVVIFVFGMYAEKAWQKYNEASEKLGYPSVFPPPPGGTSAWHKKQIEEIDRMRIERERPQGSKSSPGGIPYYRHPF